MISEWGPPTAISLQTPRGTLVMNDQNGADGYFIVRPESTIGPSVRATTSNKSQKDGGIPHRRWLTPTLATIVVQLWVDESDDACGEQRQAMHDLLYGHARSLLRALDNEGRFLWTPEGFDRRMLDDIRLESYPASTFDESAETVTFSVITGYPYAIDLTQTNPTVNATTATLTNGGTAEFWPVVKVHGATSAFTLTNNNVLDENGDPLSFVYNGPTIPGGSYLEIDFFRETAYVNGDGANRKAGIDITGSDFWPLLPGANSITTDCNAEFLINDAWA